MRSENICRIGIFLVDSIPLRYYIGTMKTRLAKKTADRLNTNTVIGLFRLRGTSMKAWCERNQLNRSYAWLSITGERNGPKARRIVRMIREELGL